MWLVYYADLPRSCKSLCRHKHIFPCSEDKTSGISYFLMELTLFFVFHFGILSFRLSSEAKRGVRRQSAIKLNARLSFGSRSSWAAKRPRVIGLGPIPSTNQNNMSTQSDSGTRQWRYFLFQGYGTSLSSSTPYIPQYTVDWRETNKMAA